MIYRISYTNPSTHLVDIEFEINNIKESTLILQLPSWRPGRYELGNFAKNIQRFEVFNKQNVALSFKKISKDRWEVNTNGQDTVLVRYNYYANQLDAGACWLDDKQLYINPVHCCLHVPDRLNEPHTIDLTVPGTYKVATSLKIENQHTLKAINYHELVDSPFIASATLQHNTFEVEGVLFHIWFQGECKPDWERILNDFSAYTVSQIKAYGAFPVKEYHYLIQVTPYRHYHGVEHLANTVIAIGPGYNLMKKEIYTDLLGVCSHELYHSWNIKSIRPIEMYPYNYVQENYSRLGYVAEGVTTYYGDLFLARSGVFNLDEYFEELNQRVNKHLNNYGRFSMSVAQASFDTWLDGYVLGIPNRKTSIYDEGCLITLMTDLLIRKHTSNKQSLDDIMKHLYNEFALKNRGYSEDDYLKTVETISGRSFTDFFTNYVNGVYDYLPLLQETLSFAGCTINAYPSKNTSEGIWGFKVIAEGNKLKVAAVAPNSPAYKTGLSIDDELISINGYRIDSGNLNDWLSYFGKDAIELSIVRAQHTHTITLNADNKEYYPNHKVELLNNRTAEQEAFLRKWIGLNK